MHYSNTCVCMWNAVRLVRVSVQHSTCTIQNSRRCISHFQIYECVCLFWCVFHQSNTTAPTRRGWGVFVCMWNDVELIAHAPKETYTVCVWNNSRGVCMCFWNFIKKIRPIQHQSTHTQGMGCLRVCVE